MNGRSRWVPHNFNPVDALTKLKGAHVQPLLDMLLSGFYHLKNGRSGTQSEGRAEGTDGNYPEIQTKWDPKVKTPPLTCLPVLFCPLPQVMNRDPHRFGMMVKNQPACTRG